MSKITEYTSVNTFDSGDVLLKDGTNGTKIIPVESAASEFLRLGGQNDKNDQIETALRNFGSNLAGLEVEYVATKDYAVGDFFMVENKLYEATASISDGDTITPDTNCVETDISTEFKATKEIVDGLSEEIVKKANVDGYYANLSAGTADQLMASQKVHNSDPYIFRTSGGTSDIGNREELEIVGGSVVWNQLVKVATGPDAIKSIEISGITITNNGDGSFTFNGTATATNRFQFSADNETIIKGGHKFFIGGGLVDGSADSYYFFITYSGGNADSFYKDCIYDRATKANQFSLRFTKGTVIENLTLRPQLFDLTAMFGSEIADHIYELEQAEAGAGVAWFRKYFPNDYYDYNSGELMHVSDLQSHDTVGFNLFDADTVLEAIGFTRQSDGSFYVATSSSVVNKTVWKNKANYSGRICVSYSYKYDSAQNQGVRFLFYYTDGTKTDNYADGSTSYSDKTIISSANKTIDRITLSYGTGSTATWLKDICINLSWSGTRDGEYEPYVKHSYPLDSSLTLRGIPKLTADGGLTYDGDIYKPDGTVERRVHIVSDLGTLTWVYVADKNQFRAALPNYGDAASNLPAFMTADYKNVAYNKMDADKVFTLFYWTLKGINIRDDSFEGDVDAFKAHITGHKLVYVGAITTEEAEPYTSPQIVNDWGTEEFVTTSIVPVGHNTSYPANLRDKLQHLPDLPDGDGYYMTQVTGTQMSLVRFRIPQAPAEDGTYVLKATVTDGVPVYTWVDPDAEPENEEPTEP